MLYHLLKSTLHSKANACNTGTCFRFYMQIRVEKNNAFAHRIYSPFTQQWIFMATPKKRSKSFHGKIRICRFRIGGWNLMNKITLQWNENCVDWIQIFCFKLFIRITKCQISFWNDARFPVLRKDNFFKTFGSSRGNWLHRYRLLSGYQL